jgi:hypothetical protein
MDYLSIKGVKTPVHCHAKKYILRILRHYENRNRPQCLWASKSKSQGGKLIARENKLRASVFDYSNVFAFQHDKSCKLGLVEYNRDDTVFKRLFSDLRSADIFPDDRTDRRSL